MITRRAYRIDGSGRRRPVMSIGALVIALPWLLYTYLPRPPIAGAQFLVYPAMAAVLAVFVGHFLTRSTRLPRPLLSLLALVLLLNITTAVSFLINAEDLRLGAVAELFRPGLFMIFLLFGYLAAERYGGSDVRGGLLVAAKAMLLGQTVLAVAQLAGMPVLDFVYSVEKARPLSSLARATGSLGNPNSLAWVASQAAVIVLLLGRLRWPWLILGGLVILGSGSRTVLLAFPLMMVLSEVWRRGGGVRQYALGAGAMVMAVCAVVALVFLLADYLPYLGELRVVMLYGSLDSINSFANRLNIWSTVFREFSGGGPVTWAFGLGSQEMTRVLDNDYMYVLFRLGIAGFAIHVVLIASLGRILAVGPRPIALVGLEYLIFSLVLGLAFETLGGWNFPLLLYFHAGAAAVAGDADVSRAYRSGHSAELIRG